MKFKNEVAFDINIRKYIQNLFKFHYEIIVCSIVVEFAGNEEN